MAANYDAMMTDIKKACLSMLLMICSFTRMPLSLFQQSARQAGLREQRLPLLP